MPCKVFNIWGLKDVFTCRITSSIQARWLYRSEATTWLIYTLDIFLLPPAGFGLSLDFFSFLSTVLEWIGLTGGDLDAVHPAATTNPPPPPRVKFFSLTHSIPPNTIDLTYWCEGAWLLRGIWPQHIEHAVSYSTAVRERNRREKFQDQTIQNIPHAPG